MTEELSRLMVEAFSNAVVVSDTCGLIVRVNAAAEHLFGASRAELIGQPAELFDPNADGALQRADGSVVPVAFHNTRLPTPGGEYGLRELRDTVEEKTTKTALRDSELRYRRLFESAKDGILILDATSGMVVDVNPFLMTLMGFTHAEFLGKAIWELGLFRDQPASEQMFAELREKEYIRYEHLPLETRDGEAIEVEFVSNVYLVAGQKVIQCNIRDVTARRKTEAAVQEENIRLESRVAERTAQLEATNQELEAFSYSVSHDLRAPLRAMDGFSQAVLEDFGNLLPEKGRSYLETIRSASQQMGTLIDDLLAFSRLGRAAAKREQIPTGDLVREVIQILAPDREGRRIDLRVGELPDSIGDPLLLRQVWINLLSNAFKYTRRKDAAVVEIGCQLQRGQPVFFVRDNGTGFDMRYAGKLFGVFQRLHRTEDFEGTGVGLAIVQRIIHRHGGTVWADATVDGGATFCFTLNDHLP